MTPQRDAYAVLQVLPDADRAVIQAAYHALARRYHADGKQPNAERMVEINCAWERLRSVDRRARYNAERRQVAVGPGPISASPREPYDPWKSVGAQPARTEPDVIDFGRYAGWRIPDLARHDPDYLRWLSRHSTGVRFLDIISRYLPGDPSIGRRTGLVG